MCLNSPCVLPHPHSLLTLSPTPVTAVFNGLMTVELSDLRGLKADWQSRRARPLLTLDEHASLRPLSFFRRPALRPSTRSLVRTASAAWTRVFTLNTLSPRPSTDPQSTCSRCTAPSSSTLCTLWCLPPGTPRQLCLTLTLPWWETEVTLHFV